MPEIWDTADLMEVTYPDQDAPPDGWWLNRYYQRQYASTRRKIYFDEIGERDRRLAPFVAPNAMGRVMRSRGSTVASFAPAYVKPKHEVDPSKALTRRPGEPLAGIGNGTLTPDQRYDAAVADNLRSEREMIERRWDWMACQATVYGEVVIRGEDYPEVTVGFNRDPSLEYTPTGGAVWSNPSADVLGQIAVARLNAFKRGRAAVNDVVMGLDALGGFMANTKVQDLLKTDVKGAEQTVLDRTGVAVISGAQFIGTIGGPAAGGAPINIWAYSNDYEDPEDGEMHDFMDAGDVALIGTGLGGVRAFGAIMDKKARLQALPIFPKMWEDEDPSATWTMSQSAPLMVPTNANNTALIHAL
jgi:hypothetical protein